MLQASFVIACVEFRGETSKKGATSARRPFVRVSHLHASAQTSVLRRRPFAWKDEVLTLPVNTERATAHVTLVETRGRRGCEEVVGCDSVALVPFAGTACLSLCGGAAFVTVAWRVARLLTPPADPKTATVKAPPDDPTSPDATANRNRVLETPLLLPPPPPRPLPGVSCSVDLAWAPGQGLGLRLRSVGASAAAAAAAAGTTTGSVHVSRVHPGGAADLSGLGAWEGCVLAAVDGKAVSDEGEVHRACEGKLGARLLLVRDMELSCVPAVAHARAASRASGDADDDDDDDGAGETTTTTTTTAWRVVGLQGALVRAAEPCASEVVAVLRKGTAVQVARTRGRRARVTHPVVGWASVEDAAGAAIMLRAELAVCCDCGVRTAGALCGVCGRAQCAACCDTSHPARGAAFGRRAAEAALASAARGEAIKAPARGRGGGAVAAALPQAFTCMRQTVGLALRSRHPEPVAHAWQHVLDDRSGPVILRKLLAFHARTLAAQQLEPCMDNVIIVLWGCDALEAIFTFGRVLGERLLTSARANLPPKLNVTLEEAAAALRASRTRAAAAAELVEGSASLSCAVAALWQALQPYTPSVHAALVVVLLQLFLPGVSYGFATLLALEEVARRRRDAAAEAGEGDGGGGGSMGRAAFAELVPHTLTRWCDSVLGMTHLAHVLAPAVPTLLSVARHLHDTEALLRK